MKKQLTFCLALLALLCTSSSAQLPSYLPADGLVGWWPFNGNANDESGNGNDGVVNGATLTEDRNGVLNAAYSFDGVNDFINSPSFAAITGSTNRTYSFWLRCEANSAGGWTISNGPELFSQGGACAAGFHIDAKIINADCSFQGIGVGINCSQRRVQTIINDGIWKHVAVVYDGSGLSATRIFINTEEITSPFCNDGTASWNVPNTSAANGLSFGKRNDNYSNTFLNGSLDDIAIYNRALTAQEIQNLYTGTTPAACLDLPSNLQDGLVGYWPFCGNANDESGNGNNGTVNGATLAADRFGNAGSAYSFDGVDDNIQTTYSGVGGSQSRTVSFWAKLSQISPPSGDNMNVINYGASGDGATFEVALNHGCEGLTLDINNGVNTKSAIINDNTWSCYTLVFDNSLGDNFNAVSYYQNSELLNTTCQLGVLTQINTILSNSMVIGSYWNLQTRFFSGLLDDITIYNRALSPEEVTQLYAVQSTGNPNAGGSLVTTGPLANVPRGISYQAVARDAQGQAIVSSPVNVRFTLHQGTPTGNTEYSETHALTTNAIGLFNTYFGSGTAITSAFDSIVWSNTTKFLQVEIDLGNGYVDMGTQQLMSVPYAYRANEAAAAGTIRNNALPVYPDNAAALAGGLVAGEMYRTATGDLKVVY